LKFRSQICERDSIISISIIIILFSIEVYMTDLWQKHITITIISFFHN